MPQNKEEIHVIYLGDGETWDLAKECTLIFNAVYDELTNLPLPSENSIAIKLTELIPLALQQVFRNKAIKISKPISQPPS
jgi:hypothetical protein